MPENDNFDVNFLFGNVPQPAVIAQLTKQHAIMVQMNKKRGKERQESSSRENCF